VLKSGEVSRMSMLRTTPTGAVMALRVGVRTAFSRLRNQRLATNGGALVAQLLELLQRREVAIWTETPLLDLIEQDGRVVGASVRRNGRSLRVRARRGVLLATGGFAYNAEMRKKYGPQPNDGEWTTCNTGDTGEGLECAMSLGAATAMLDAAWWIPTLLGPDNTRHQSNTRMVPGSIIVDSLGHRYMNESEDYVRCGYAMYKRHEETGAAIPSWTIFDSWHRSRYLFGKTPPGKKAPQDWLDSGHLKTSETLEGLAIECGIEPATLRATIERFNKFTDTGVDEDFHRGDTPHERYYGDPSLKANSCLGPIAKGPFYASKTYPGDVGTSGGVVCNEYAQVLNEQGDPIPGLYAAGNVTASVMGRVYPGAGASIGASAVFAFIAGNHAASHGATEVG
jgi:3-oxosteroid 1-dehydrogenase